MKKVTSVLIAALVLPSISAMAAERATITSPDQLKPGQCAYASEIYEPGELIVSRVKGIAQICGNINGQGVGLTLAKESLDLLQDKIATVREVKASVREVQVAGTKINLVDSTTTKGGVSVICKQFVSNVKPAENGRPIVVTLDKECRSAS